MDAHIRKVYVPMTETGFYILYCLQEEMHGYNIGLRVKVMTCGEVTISPGICLRKSLCREFTISGRQLR